MSVISSRPAAPEEIKGVGKRSRGSGTVSTAGNLAHRRAPGPTGLRAPWRGFARLGPSGPPSTDGRQAMVVVLSRVGYNLAGCQGQAPRRERPMPLHDW